MNRAAAVFSLAPNAVAIGAVWAQDCLEETMRLFHGTVLTVAMLALGCASGGASAGADEPGSGPGPQASGDSFSKDVGLATAADLERQTNRILERYQYSIERFDIGAYSFIDTRWKDRPVTEDERASGFVAARTRIMIRTRLRSRATDPVLAVHRVTFNAENLVRRAAGGDWERVVTEGFLDHVSRIALQFETEFRAGIRR
jgi:hypothetical protein